MGDPGAQMDKRDQQPVDEHQPVVRTDTQSPLPRPGGKPDLVTLVPQRPDLADEFGITPAVRPVLVRSAGNPVGAG
ncbi:hypothetical protein QF037_009124 [Streptomyces canus]|nr:hypothetical protein [Streptomyces canus]